MVTVEYSVKHRDMRDKKVRIENMTTEAADVVMLWSCIRSLKKMATKLFNVRQPVKEGEIKRRRRGAIGKIERIIWELLSRETKTALDSGVIMFIQILILRGATYQTEIIGKRT